MKPPQEDIDLALQIEAEARNRDWDFYLECMNGKPMSERTTDVDLYNGCILTNGVYMEARDETT